MTDAQFNKWMSLNEQFKKMAFIAMNINDQTDCLNRVYALDGGEKFCTSCPYWNETTDGYGICQYANGEKYNERTNGMDACYSDIVSENARIINEAIVSQIQYSKPSQN